MNLASIIRTHAINQAERTAIVYGEQLIDYAQLWRTLEDIAAQLQQAGVGPGDRVGLSMPDHPLHLIAHYALAYLGAVIVPIDHRWADPEKRAAVKTFHVRVVASDTPIDGLDGARTVHLRVPAAPAAATALDDKIHVRDPGDLLLSLSSGTTGKPKGAVVSHRQLYERFVSQWVTIGLNGQDGFAVLTPLYFGAGRSFAMSTLASGGTVHLAPPPMPTEQVLAALARTGVTATFAPPTLLRRWLPVAGPSPMLGHLRRLIVSGEPLHSEEAHQVRQSICPNLLGYYASSEGGGIAVLQAHEFAAHAATVGTPTFRTEVQIVDQNGEPLAVGDTGRLRYRGPGVATRFIRSDGTEHDSNAGGWFYPGDLAQQLPGGRIALRGRDKDVIIRAGVNIYPSEIEQVLMAFEGIDESAVLGQRDAQRGQVVIAFIACSPGAMDIQALEAHCRERLAPYKIPAQFIQLPSLPKANSGKVDKQALLKTDS